MALTLPEVKGLLAQRYDPDDICEALELSTEDLLDKFEDRVVKYLYKFEDDLEDFDDQEN